MKTYKSSLTLAAVSLLLLTAGAHATNRTWTGGGPDNNWNDAANWGGTAPAVSGDSLIFSTAIQQNNTNNYAAITNVNGTGGFDAISFSTGGWVLSGNPVTLSGAILNSAGTNQINLNVALTATRTFDGAGGQLIVNGVVSGPYGVLTGAGSGSVVLTATNTYTGGAYLNPGDCNLIITRPGALGTGTVSIPKTGTQTGTLQLMLSGINTIANPFAAFYSTTAGATAVPDIENISGSNTITSSLVVTGTGGNGLTVLSDAGLLTLAGAVGTTIASREVQLYGAGNGVVSGGIYNASGDAFPVQKYGTGTWTLNGTNTMTGGVIINAGTLALGATGSISNAPAVNLEGAGTVFDVSAIAGGWVQNAGQSLVGAGGVNGSVVAASGATISPGIPLTFSNNLALNGVTLPWHLSSDPTGLTYPSDQIIVDGNFSASATNAIQLGTYLEGYIPNGTWTLFTNNGTFTGSATNFAVTGFTPGGRGVQNGYIVTGAHSVSLVVTGTPPASLVWQGDGVNNYWDIQMSKNWLNGTTNDVFYNYDSVTFNDSTTNFTVNIDTNVQPGSVTVDSTNNYVFNGTASSNILGAASLTKLGSGTLTINENNNYTGVTTYGGGNLSVSTTIGGAGVASLLGAAANTPASQYFNGGTLEYTGGGETSGRSFSFGPAGGTVQVDTIGVTLNFTTAGSTLWTSAGGNALTKTGPGTLAFGNGQFLTGTNSVHGGILKIAPVGSVGLFGSDFSSPVFVNGGELDLNAQNMSTKPVVVQGMGDPVLNANSGTTNGAIINSGASQTQGLQFVTMTGDAAFGGTGRWDLRANPTASLSTGGNAYNLVKAGANQVSLVGVTVDPALANIDVQAGTLSYELGATGLGNPANTLTVESGATLDFYAATIPLNKQIVLHDNGTVSASSGASTIVGPVNMLGDTESGPTFTMASGISLNLAGLVSGAGNLTQNGAGTLTLTATNNYTGTTTVNGGLLTISSAQTGNGDITVADGAALGVTVSGTAELAPNNFNLGSGGGVVTNQFSGVSSTTVAPLNVTNLNVNDPVTINILSGNFLTGQTYPLIAFQNLSGAGSFVLGTLPALTTGTLVTNGNAIALNVISSAAIEFWSGNVNGNWNIGTTANWKLNGSSATYANGNNVEFDDTASSASVNITTTVLPKSVIFNNNVLTHSLAGSPIGGTNSLNVQGAGEVVLNSANSYSGGSLLSAGTLFIDNNGALGTGPVTFNGGAIGNNGSGPVTLTNALAWNTDFTFVGDQSITLSAAGVTLVTNRQITATGTSPLTVSGVISDGGAGYSLTQAGAGTLTLSGTNTYSGGTMVSIGTINLQGNQSQANGGLLISPLSYGGTVNIAAGAIVSVAVTNNAGVTNQIQVGSSSAGPGSTSGYLTVSGSVTNNGSLLAMRASVVTLNTNSAWLQNGDMQITGEGGYSGELDVTAGGSFTYTGSDIIQVNGASGNTGHGLLYISGLFTTAAGFDQTTSPSSGYGLVELLGGGILSLSAPLADITTNADVQFELGAGGGVIDTYGFAANLSYPVYGPGSLTKVGAGTLTLLGADVYTGNTIINAGTLALGASGSFADTTNIIVAGGATLDVSATSLALESQVLSNSTSTATLAGNIDASSGSVSLTYASGMPSFDVTNGTLNLASTTVFQVNNTGATLGNGNYLLIATNLSGAVTVSDTTPAVTITGNGMGSGGTASLVLNNGELFLNVTGASTVNTSSPVLTNSISGSTLTLSWPADHLGWQLQMQTNPLSTGLGTNWSTWPNSANVTSTNITINPANPTTFFRLVYP